MNKIKNTNRGISFIEIIITISILLIILSFVVPNLSDFNKQQILKNTTENIVSLLNKARNNTISSKNSNNYGVHFETDRVVLFTGDSFEEDVSNEEINLDSSVEIPSQGGINLGGSENIVFQKITGEASNSGTILLQLINDHTKQKVISISIIGIIGSN